MNSLIVDCSAGMSLYLMTEHGDYCVIDENEKRHSDELLVSLDELLKKACLKISNIDHICVCIGPGSFTGIRVAVSICKGLAIGAKAKVYALSNLDIYEIDKVKKSALVLDGFSEFLYVRVFDEKNFFDKCISISDLKLMYDNEEIDIFACNEKVQKKLNNYEIICKNAKLNIKNAFLSKINKQESINLNQINPLQII